MKNVKGWDWDINLWLFSTQENKMKKCLVKCTVLGSQSRKIKYTNNYLLIHFNSIIYKISKWNSTFFFYNYFLMFHFAKFKYDNIYD